MEAGVITIAPVFDKGDIWICKSGISRHEYIPFVKSLSRSDAVSV
jgi:hypothetical protein